MDALVAALDLIGTFVFALSGGMVGVRHRLDIFGLLVRDLLLGAVPPAAIADRRYIVVSLLAGATSEAGARHRPRAADGRSRGTLQAWPQHSARPAH